MRVENWMKQWRTYSLTRFFASIIGYHVVSYSDSMSFHTYIYAKGDLDLLGRHPTVAVVLRGLPNV